MKFWSSFTEKRKLILLSSLNAAALVVLTFTWINKSYILTDDEEYLIKATTATKDILFKNIFRLKPDKPAPEDFLFVNLSWEKQLIDVKDGNGQTIGKRPITNRQRIARFLELLNRNPEHKYILLDVWFKDSSDYHSDSLLQVQFRKTPHILIPYHKSEADDHRKDLPIFSAPVALSDYEKDDMDNNFVKFRLVQGDHFKTTPLVLYEKLKGEKFSDDGWFSNEGDKLALNSFILKIRISDYDLKPREIAAGKIGSNYTKVQMVDLIGSEELQGIPVMDSVFAAGLHAMTKGRIVVIGDFEDTDIHQTIYGPTPGPLILLNVYLALVNGDNLIDLSFVIFLFTGFFLISYKCFADIDYIEKFLIRKILPFSSVRTYIAGFIDYLIYFILLSVISYFIFNVHLTILLLAIYMEMLAWLWKYWESRSEKKLKTETVSTELS